MAHAFLRAAPAADPRPEPLAEAVLKRATNARLDEIRAWLKPRLPTLSDEEIGFALMAAMKLGGADGFRTSVKLHETFGWPVDMELCQFVRDTCNALAFALRVETRLWSVRVGLRFPARAEERIEWCDDQERGWAGKVISVDDGLALGIVQRFDGAIRMGAPVRVFAEAVTANLTKGEYAPAATDARRGLTLAVDNTCPECLGEGLVAAPGQDLLGERCPVCDGTGKA